MEGAGQRGGQQENNQKREGKKRDGIAKQRKSLRLRALRPPARGAVVGQRGFCGVVNIGPRRCRPTQAQAVRMTYCARCPHPKTKAGEAKGQKARQARL